jgi:hypothetical protein
MKWKTCRGDGCRECRLAVVNVPDRPNVEVRLRW